MARRELFLRRRGTEEWPDGTVAARYQFIHSLYQNVLYQRTAAARRVLLHRRIGECAEAAWGNDARAIAAELAAHFEEGRDIQRALRYLRAAAENAARRYANREAIHYLTRAQGLAARLPEGEREATDMALPRELGILRRSMGDMRGAAEDFRVRRALGAASRVTPPPRPRPSSTWPAPSPRSTPRAAWPRRGRRSFSAEMSRTSSSEPTPAARPGYWHSFLRGWRREDADACAEALATARTADDPGLLSLLLGRYAYFQIIESAYREACATSEEGMRLALEVGDAYEYLFSAYYRALGLLYLGRWGEMLALVQEGIRMGGAQRRTHVGVLFRLQRAWLAWRRATRAGLGALCEAALEQAREPRRTRTATS